MKVGKIGRHLPDREHSHQPGRDGEHSHRNTKLRPSADFDKHSYSNEASAGERVRGEILEKIKGMPGRTAAWTSRTCGQRGIN